MYWGIYRWKTGYLEVLLKQSGKTKLVEDRWNKIGKILVILETDDDSMGIHKLFSLLLCTFEKFYNQFFKKITLSMLIAHESPVFEML